MRRGVTLVELVIVLVIVSLTAGVFHGLITQMIDSGMTIMGRKESYQQAREALQRMADEIRYNVRGGANHNLGVATAGAWQNNTNPCTSSRFTFYPDQSDARWVNFRWRPSTGPSEPPGYLLIREEVTLAPTVLARVPDAGGGALEVRYYDAANTQIVVGGDLTDAQARSVTRIELLLTVNQWGKPVTLSETVYIREKGLPPQEPGML